MCRTQVSAAIYNSLNSRDTLSWEARSKSGSRNTARATANASIGSDLSRVPDEARLCPINFGGTRTSYCPAVSRLRSRGADGCGTSSRHVAVAFG